MHPFPLEQVCPIWYIVIVWTCADAIWGIVLSKYNRCMITFAVTRGIRQGEPLSPSLYYRSVIISPVRERIKPSYLAASMTKRQILKFFHSSSTASISHGNVNNRLVMQTFKRRRNNNLSIWMYIAKYNQASFHKRTGFTNYLHIL